MSDNPRQDAVDALVAERYGRNTWWTTRPTPPPVHDDDITTARRRRLLAQEASDHPKEASG